LKKFYPEYRLYPDIQKELRLGLGLHAAATADVTLGEVGKPIEEEDFGQNVIIVS
jgi:hypothetical protein